MKTIFTLLLASIFTTTAFAFDEGRISITVVSGKGVQVFVDGRAYSTNSNTLVLEDVQPGNHNIKIYSAMRNNGNGRNGGRRADRNADLIYASTLYLRPGHHVDVMVNRFGKALVDERAIDGGNGIWNDEEDRWKGKGDYSSGNRAMSDNEFNRLLQSVRGQWFGRLGAAKDAIERNYFQVVQVRQLLQVFTSESDKLELAKLSYKSIVDRQNFRQLYDLFSYRSQTELDRYARDARY
ncbi:MAG TPA: DUF4476 domain-containing protein [Flavisolibacter sp.]|nr:DUF4476 domain-containing protein [Flavisolibacter sp.]